MCNLAGSEPCLLGGPSLGNTLVRPMTMLCKGHINYGVHLVVITVSPPAFLIKISFFFLLAIYSQKEKLKTKSATIKCFLRFSIARI
jgi:hypothetical protein